MNSLHTPQEKLATILLCGSEAKQWAAPLRIAGFEVRVAQNRPWALDADASPHLIVVQDTDAEAIRTVVDLRATSEAQRIPIVVILDDSTTPLAREAALAAGADEVLFSAQGPDSLVQAAQLLIGTMFLAGREEARQDAVNRALEVATAVGQTAQFDEDDTVPRLALSSSLSQAIDFAEKTYAVEQAKTGKYVRLEPRDSATRASNRFGEFLGVTDEASEDLIVESATALLAAVREDGDNSALAEAMKRALAAIIQGSAGSR